MRVTLYRTGDPWRDRGIVMLHDMLELMDHLVYKNQLTKGLLRFELKSTASSETLVQEVANFLRDKMNQLILPPPEVKVLGYNYLIRNQDGFCDPRYSIKLSKQERAAVKEKLKTANVKPEVSLRRNYIGIKNDWIKLKGEVVQTVTEFVRQHTEFGDSEERCMLCSLPMGKQSFSARQNKNPFFNQHHNYKVRGMAASLGVGTMCPTCNLLNMLAAVHTDVPYFVSSETHMLVPVIQDLNALHTVARRISGGLIDLLSPDVLSYTTNISHLRHRQVYIALIAVYYSIVHKYSRESDTWTEDYWLSTSDQRIIDKWIVVRFSKGNNVNFSNFNTIRVSNRLFSIVRDIAYGMDNAKRGNILTSFFNRVSVGDSRLLDDLARGIINGSWGTISSALFQILKEVQRGGRARVYGGAVSFFTAFTDYLAREVDCLLDEQLLEDIKIIGRTLGSVFAGDIGFMTNINNISDVASLRRVLKTALFRMHKMVVAKGTEGKVIVPKEQRVERILNSASSENIGEIRDMLLIYASLKALAQTVYSDSEAAGREQG